MAVIQVPNVAVDMGAQPTVGQVFGSPEDALAEIVEMPHKRSFWEPLSSTIVKDPRRREQLRRLVQLLRHSDRRVRQACFDMLNQIQPDRPGGIDALHAWDQWLAKLEISIGGSKAPTGSEWITEGWPSVEDLYLDVIRIRSRFRAEPASWLRRDKERYDATRRLIHYLRHPDPRVRVAADETLVQLFLERQGSPDTPELWEKWLQSWENSTAP